MTHHITDEQIAQIAEQVGLVGPASRAGDCHAASLRFARAVLALAAQQGEPVAAQCRFEGDAEWKPCTVAHHLLVQAHQKEWPHYETRALYTAPAPAVPSGWSITDNGDNSITVHGPGLGCTVSDVEEVARRVPSEVLYEFCRAMLTAAPTPPAQSEPTDLTGCNCRWKGGAQVEWCEHHLAHRDAIHDWAQRAKIAEAKLTAATPAVPSLQPACRYISEVLAGDAPSGEKHIARTIMHLLPLEQAMQATPAVPEDVAREPMTQRWCWWLGDAETFHVANTESEAHSEAQSRIDDDCEPGDTREYSVGRVQHPIDALGVEWLAEHVAETIEENTREWCDDNTGAEDPSITLAAEDRKVLGTMVAAFLREKVSVHWWTADQKTITTHTYVAGSNDADAARAAEKGGE